MFKLSYPLQEGEGEGEGGGGGGDAKTNAIAPEVIDEAKSLGWVPEDQFKGRKSEWVDADEFVRRGKEILPIVKENLRRVQDDLKKAKEEISSFGKTAEEFRKFTEEAAERKVNEWKAEAEALKQQLAKAVTDGEGDVAAELLDTIEKHKQAEPKKAPPVQEPKIDPEFTKWREANQWYEQEDLQAAAIAQGIRLNKKYGYVGPKLYNAVREEMAKLFPDDVPSDGDNGGMFEAGGSSGRRTNINKSKTKTYENLPPEAKAACDRMLAKGFLKTRDQYVANYDWSGE